MRLTYRRMYNRIEGKKYKIHDQTITKLFFVPQNTDTKFKKQPTKARKKVQL